MLAGRFARFEHDHNFIASGRDTVLRDELRFSLPCGVAGRILGRTLVSRYVEALLQRRCALIRQLAEGEGWRRYLDATSDSAASET
jgi:ligand-binding SRPBCC domain-containing protein